MNKANLKTYSMDHLLILPLRFYYVLIFNFLLPLLIFYEIEQFPLVSYSGVWYIHVWSFVDAMCHHLDPIDLQFQYQCCTAQRK